MLRSKLFFNAPGDESAAGGLWLSNGTDAGTHEVAGINGVNALGIDPLYLTVYDGEVLFSGISTNGSRGLWFTDGTAAGTVPIGGPGSTGIAGANPQGLQPGYFHVYDGKVLFRGLTGVAGNNVPSLWITDGTVAGTTQIGGVANAGIAGVFSGGFLPADPDFTTFNGKVLFSARDQFNQIGLWSTDGTAAGTIELGPIAGAAFDPNSAPHPELDIQPRDMAIVGNRVIFAGADQQDTPGSLWMTDGTKDGTIEIGGQGNAAVPGSPNGFKGQFTSELPMGIQPYDITTFGNKAIFAGYDNTLKPNGFYARTDGLWLTDGTPGGTTEIGGLGNAGIANANPALDGGIFWEGSIEYPDFTVYNGIVLFVGRDTSGHIGLWKTDGTAGGTVPIGGVGNAGIAAGLQFSGAENPDFTLYAGKVYFNGIAGDGNSGFWVTDGTAQGTHPVNDNFLGSPNAILGPDLTVVPAPHDFNGDGQSDVLFAQNGAVFASNYEWQLNDRSLAGQGAIDLFEKAFSVQVVGDFSGDGKADVLFQNPSTGGVWEWQLDGTQVALQGAVDVGDPAFHLLGSADFNGDGKDDLLFRNNAGFLYEWQMHGLDNTPKPVGPLDPTWHVQGTGDFNGDGKDDILLRRIGGSANENGSFFLWEMNGNLIQAQGGIERPPTTWKTLGIGDFDGDGKADFAVRNVSSTPDNGAVWVYLMNGTVIKGQGAAGIADAATWHLQEIGDFNGDGKDDILFRNDAGYFYSWDMNGTHIASEGLLQGGAQWADPSITVVKPFWDLV